MPRNTIHPDNTSLNPYNTQELEDEPETQYKRDLYMVAKRLRTTESQLKTELSKLGLSYSDDLLSVTISENRAMVQSPARLPAIRRAKTAQNNLRSIYQQWANLCEKHQQAVESQQ